MEALSPVSAGLSGTVRDDHVTTSGHMVPFPLVTAMWDCAAYTHGHLVTRHRGL